MKARVVHGLPDLFCFKLRKVCMGRKAHGHKKRSAKTDLTRIVRLTRFERATSTSAGWRSNPTELQSHKQDLGECLFFTEATGVEPAQPDKELTD